MVGNNLKKALAFGTYPGPLVSHTQTEHAGGASESTTKDHLRSYTHAMGTVAVGLYLQHIFLALDSLYGMPDTPCEM